jgi:hypothetical protein
VRSSTNQAVLVADVCKALAQDLRPDFTVAVGQALAGGTLAAAVGCLVVKKKPMLFLKADLDAPPVIVSAAAEEEEELEPGATEPGEEAPVAQPAPSHEAAALEEPAMPAAEEEEEEEEEEEHQQQQHEPQDQARHEAVEQGNLF